MIVASSFVKKSDIGLEIKASNGGVDAAARIQSSNAGPVMMRDTPPPLASNDLLCRPRESEFETHRIGCCIGYDAAVEFHEVNVAFRHCRTDWLTTLFATSRIAKTKAAAIGRGKQ